MNSRKLVFKMSHSRALRPPYGRPESSRLLKVNHYMLDVRIKVRSGAYASSRQHTDTDTGGQGSQAFRPPVHDERYGLPDLVVCTRRSEGRRIWSGPQGTRDHVLRL
jgi:hypothetical protein